MVNSNHGPERGRKEERYDFIGYVEELKNRLDIFQVAALHGITVNEHGQADCFNNHDEKTPSLKFYEDTQTYHCFGCKAHGDVISLVQQVEGCSFMTAVNSLSDEAGMALFENNNGFDAELFSRVSDCLNAGAEVYHNWLAPKDSC